MAESIEGNTGRQPRSRGLAHHPPHPLCTSNKGASVPGPPACTAVAETLRWNRNHPLRGPEGLGVSGRSPLPVLRHWGNSPRCRHEQRVQEKQGVGAGDSWILKYGQWCYFYRGVFILGGRWDRFNSLFLQLGGI